MWGGVSQNPTEGGQFNPPPPRPVSQSKGPVQIQGNYLPLNRRPRAWSGVSGPRPSDDALSKQRPALFPHLLGPCNSAVLFFCVHGLVLHTPRRG